MNFTKLIGTQVISAHNGKLEGFVSDVIFSKNYKKLKALLIVNDMEEKQILKTNYVYKIGEEIVLIKNSSALLVAEPENYIGIINKQTIDIEGNNLGRVTEIEIGDKWIVDNIITENSNFLPQKIICVDDFIVLNTNDTHFKPHNFAPKLKIEKVESTATVEAMQPVYEKIEPKPTTPTQVKVNTSLDLLGKRLRRDFIVFGNQILAPRNTVITSSLLSTAKQMNVLNELYLLVN